MKCFSACQPTILSFSQVSTCYSVLQGLVQYYSVLQSTTKCYSNDSNTTPYYSSTTPYYSSRTTKHYTGMTARRPSNTTPVLQSTTSTTPVQSTLQYYPVLQSTTGTTSERRRTTKYYKYYSSTTPYYKVLLQYYKSFQNEHFVRGFRNFSSNKLPKRAFRARLPRLFMCSSFQNEHFVRDVFNFQSTRVQNEHFVRGFRNFSSNKLPKRAFRERLPQLFKEEASKCCACHAKRENDLESLTRQNEHFVRDFLQIKFHTFNSIIDDFVRGFLIRHFYRAQKV